MLHLKLPLKSESTQKKKGNGFEGHVGKILAETLTPMKFRRSQSSGAILGGGNARFMEQFSDDAKALFIGDVVPTNESDVFRDEGWKFKFTLECKFYKFCDNLDHIFNNTKIKGWFEQAVTDAAKLGKEPLLIFKFNRTETFCAARLGVALPGTINQIVTIGWQNPEGGLAGQSGRWIDIFLFKEALLDLEWWKVRNKC